MKSDSTRTGKTALLIMTLSLLVAGCEGPMPGKFARLAQPYPAKPKDSPIEVFQDAPPSKPYNEIARLDVHMEQGYFKQPTLKDVMPELLKQARLSGSDGIINIQERRSVLSEIQVLHVSATAIKFSDKP